MTRNAERRRARYALCLCRDCPQPRITAVCADCRTRRKASKQQQRAQRYYEGLCRDCPRPRGRHVLCGACYGKDDTRRPDKISEMRARIAALRYDTYALSMDRRQNGRDLASLGWALQMHAIR